MANTVAPDIITITLTRALDGRSWLATIPGNGRAVGLGPSPDVAVRELFHWSQILESKEDHPCTT